MEVKLTSSKIRFFCRTFRPCKMIGIDKYLGKDSDDPKRILNPISNLIVWHYWLSIALGTTNAGSVSTDRRSTTYSVYDQYLKRQGSLISRSITFPLNSDKIRHVQLWSPMVDLKTFQKLRVTKICMEECRIFYITDYLLLASVWWGYRYCWQKEYISEERVLYAWT